MPPTGPGSGNIPAPDLFNDQIACSMNVPTGADLMTPATLGKDAKKTELTIAIEGGEALDGTAIATALGFVIDPMFANCGGGDPDVTPEGASVANPAVFTVDDNGAIATDVAEGYTALLGAYVDVYGAPGDADSTGTAGTLADARKALSKAIADGDAESRIETLQKAVTTAEEADDKTRATFNAISQGPIYQAGVSEWMAKSAVTNSIASYDKALMTAGASKTVVDALEYADYVPLGNDELIDTVFTFDGEGEMSDVNLNTLRAYTNADGDMVATVDEDGVTTSTASNFDVAGKLIVPMVLDTSTTEDDEDLTTTKSEQSVMTIRQAATRHNAALEALQELQSENENALLQPLIDEAVRRAQAEAGHYDSQLSETLADNMDRRSVDQKDSEHEMYEKSPISIASLNAANAKDNNALVVAELELRATAAAREAATAHVVAQFTGPASFYEQLVARRQALQYADDKKVADASEDGGTPSKTLTDAAADAAKAVAAAEEAQAAYLAYVGETDGPTAALIDELLKGDGDDGGALVEAISGTYNAAKAALDAVEGLGGADGAVAMNTGDIEALDGRVAVNEGAILANAGNITMNAAGILANRTDIDTNTAGIATNAGDIMMNAGNIMDNRGMIETNTMGISGNSGRIDAAESMISQNQGNISGNTAMIGELSESLEVVRAGVAASMALAGMPAINGRGISIGVGSFDGESAFAIGFQIQNDATSFKVGLTSGGGATGASAGVGFQF